MQKLIEGLHQFQDNVFRPRREFFERLAEGQRPETLFVTCSDSRINPNLVLQADVGELFIIRNAGNLVPLYDDTNPGGEGATIEFAVDGLGVQELIVCGHSHCGAMKALLHPENVARLPAMAGWLAHAGATVQIVREHYSHLDGDALLTATAQENVLVQIEHLRTHPVVAAAVARGALRVHGWVYKIGTGEVFAYDSESQQFAPVGTLGVSTASPFPMARRHMGHCVGPRDPSFRGRS